MYRGVELSGRLRASRIFYVDYNYDAQSSQQTGIPVSILTSNPVLINDAQIHEIPVHKGSLTLDYNDLHGVEAQLQGFYIGPNNDLNRGGYTFFNAFVSKALGRNLTATLGATNVFEQNVQNYGYFRSASHRPGESVRSRTVAGTGRIRLQRAASGDIRNGTPFELIGLPPRLITFSLSARM